MWKWVDKFNIKKILFNFLMNIGIYVLIIFTGIAMLFIYISLNELVQMILLLFKENQFIYIIQNIIIL